MTVATTIIVAGPYEGNDVTEEFAFEFLLTDETYLLVYFTDTEGDTSVLDLTTDYTVEGVGDPEGGTITLVNGPLATGETLYLRANYPFTQTTAFASQGGFFPQVHENSFDKLTMLVNQLTDRINRAPSLPDYYPIDGENPLSLPEPDPLLYLRWNAAGSSLENAEAGDSAVFPEPVEGKYLGWDAEGNLVNLDGSVPQDIDAETVTTTTVTTTTVDTETVTATGNVEAQQFGSTHATVTISAGNATFPVDEAGTFDITVDQNCTVTLTATDVTKSYQFTVFATTTGSFNFTALAMTGITIYKRDGTSINLKANGSTIISCLYIPAASVLVVMESDLEVQA